MGGNTTHTMLRKPAYADPEPSLQALPIRLTGQRPLIPAPRRDRRQCGPCALIPLRPRRPSPRLPHALIHRPDVHLPSARPLANRGRPAPAPADLLPETLKAAVRGSMRVLGCAARARADDVARAAAAGVLCGVCGRAVWWRTREGGDVCEATATGGVSTSSQSMGGIAKGRIGFTCPRGSSRGHGDHQVHERRMTRRQDGGYLPRRDPKSVKALRSASASGFWRERRQRCLRRRGHRCATCHGEHERAGTTRQKDVRECGRSPAVQRGSCARTLPRRRPGRR